MELWVFGYVLICLLLFNFSVLNSFSVDLTGDEPFLVNKNQAILHVESLGHVLHAFVNGMLAGVQWGRMLILL